MRPLRSFSSGYFPIGIGLTLILLQARVSFSQAVPPATSQATSPSAGTLSGTSSGTAPGVSPKIKPGQFVQIKPTKAIPSKIPIRSTVVSEVTPNVGLYFNIIQRNQDYFLHLVRKDPKWVLDQNSPFLIELIPQYPVQVTPSIVTASEWPKNATELKLTVTGVPPQSDARILGKASYSYCDTSSGKCSRALVPITHLLKP